MESSTQIITYYDLIYARKGLGTTDSGANDESRQFRDTIKAIAEDKQTFSLNIDSVSKSQGSLQDDITMFTGLVTDMTGKVASLTNELAQARSEVYINNACLMFLEEGKA